jgi:23S rRNA (cytosine1962-C5)-methyltransferase
MKKYPKIYLKPKKEIPVLRFHPWVFSGAIGKKEGVAKDGDIVKVYDSRENFLAVGHYYEGSIAVKLFSFEDIIPDTNFWKEKIQKAFDIREQLHITNNSISNAYRLVHGEGDGLPGLIIDVYAKVAVVQFHAVGMYKVRHFIKDALINTLGDRIEAIYNKSGNTLPSNFAKETTDGYLWRSLEQDSAVILENNCKFQINWKTGQKTGFFLDQRNNRKLLQDFSKGKKVLNAFCYSGGFSLYALLSGAEEVHSVDASAKAIDLLEENLKLNGLEEAKHESHVGDVMRFLKDNSNQYDVMVLDPPAYAKTASKRHNAVQAYKRLNIAGLQHLKPGGILFTFSCSQVVDNQLFYNTITAAAIEAKRTVRVLHRLTQPADHPVNIFHPEGNYLKGLVLYVE